MFHRGVFVVAVSLWGAFLWIVTVNVCLSTTKTSKNNVNIYYSSPSRTLEEDSFKQIRQPEIWQLWKILNKKMRGKSLTLSFVAILLHLVWEFVELDKYKKCIFSWFIVLFIFISLWYNEILFMLLFMNLNIMKNKHSKPMQWWENYLLEEERE